MSASGSLILIGNTEVIEGKHYADFQGLNRVPPARGNEERVPGSHHVTMFRWSTGANPRIMRCIPGLDLRDVLTVYRVYQPDPFSTHNLNNQVVQIIMMQRCY